MGKGLKKKKDELRQKEFVDYSPSLVIMILNKLDKLKRLDDNYRNALFYFKLSFYIIHQITMDHKS